VPPGTGLFGMWLFMAALTMLFGATILGYVIIRFDQSSGPPLGSVHLPWQLWLSTAVILTSSFTIQRALQNVRAERQTRFTNSLMLTLLLGIGFLLLQGPALAGLLTQRFAGESASTALYGFVFSLILLHALHLVGGLIPLTVVTVKAHHYRYDHESHGPIQYMTMYWHYLGGVWIVMFFVLQTVG
jgi:heme/copper-type cytochrome/quinol oxidase subunit 3